MYFIQIKIINKTTYLPLFKSIELKKVTRNHTFLLAPRLFAYIRLKLSMQPKSLNPACVGRALARQI